MRIDKPIIAVISDSVYQDNTRLYSAGKKYIEGLVAVADVLPVIVPSLPKADLMPYLDMADGVMLTGSLSNIHPRHYHQSPTPTHEPFDETRDETALFFIHQCLERNLPLLAICRGFQELNVALGGTLVPNIHEQKGKLDHQEPDTEDRDIKHAARHIVQFPENGLFHKWTNLREMKVNSLHRQAIDKISDQLSVEAVCEDGTIEGVSVKGAPQFAVAVQWHPEYNAAQNPFAKPFFNAFAHDAKLQRQAKNGKK